MKTLSFLLLALLFANTMSAQAPAWEWARQTGGPGNSKIWGIDISPGGCIYVAGGFGVPYITMGCDTLIPFGPGWDMFVSKLDPLGNVLWAKSFGGQGPDNIHGIAIDRSGNLFVAGSSSSSQIIFGSDTLFNPTAFSGWPYNVCNIFIIKFDSSGTYQWGRSIGGPLDGLVSTGVVDVGVDNEGNVYVTSIFEYPYVVFGADTLTNMGFSDIFVAKYDSYGNYLWAISAGGTSYDGVRSLAVDESGNVTITGLFQSPIIFFDTVAVINPATGMSMFLASYDAGGNLLWAKSEGGPGQTMGYYVSPYNAGGGTVSTGFHNAPSAQFGNTTLTSAGLEDVFVAKHDQFGNLQWVTTAGGVDSDCGVSVTSDKDGAVIASGTFCSPSITIGSTTLQNIPFYGGNGGNLFVAKYDDTGNALWATSAGGCNKAYPRAIRTDDAKSIYVAGYFLEPMLVIGNDTLVASFASITKGFIAKISETTEIAGARASKPRIRIFPNPCADHINVELPDGLSGTLLVLHDIHGRMVFSKEITENTTLNLNHLPNGVYLITFINNGQWQTGKLIRMK